ncbi:MAG TPA: hypothetical protein ENN72_04305 [Firmicutes bacterium]|nr:hypothetical protein [Bacillota bacterium]
MKRLFFPFIFILIMAVLAGCQSGGNVILDKAAISKAQTSIKDLAKIVESYKRLNDGNFPPEDQPLFDSLEGFITDVKKDQFIPTFENTYNKMILEMLEKKGGINFTHNELADLFAPVVFSKDDVDMTEEEIKESFIANLEALEIPDPTESDIYDSLNAIFPKRKTEIVSYSEITTLMDTTKLKKGKEEILTPDQLTKLKKDARRIYGSSLPPFNTDPAKGGWSQPKWIIIEPDVDLIVEHRAERFTERNGRAPRARELNTWRREAETYASNSRVGYIVWVANDSNNSLVYAKVN